MFSDLERKIIALIQGDMPVEKHPYQVIAEKIGVAEETVLSVLKDLCDSGIIRRFGATLRHQKSGFNANAMIAWKVDEGRVEEVGKLMAAFDQVSHCYRRNPGKDWPYNLYTMVHAVDEASCRKIAGNISEKTKVDNYEILFSRKELKKTSMQYFDDDPDF
ncbi:MAG: Lrp/AsnC family transcriptional regulator [Desulfobacteraceae bacterium]|nr:Lrp/AsnC family transcriptional regulator [Desulfobacteraceae bacterium]MBC2757172.1 Lrp/AsnC family transcriptional regulator [Desulfobacteraceae bacterium]